MAKISINDLLEAGCHFGHQTRRWNPKMKDYVYGAKNGISIIDLTKTMYQIAAACNFLQRTVANGGEILFVGTKRQLREIVKELADTTGMYCVSERWLGGTLTNNVTIRKSITKMAEIDGTLNSDAAKSMKKKEIAGLSRRAEKLHRDLDGIAGMKRLPAALVVIDVYNEINAVREANKLNIPIVAIVDTNGDPSLVDYPVAANDDAVKSVQIITTSSPRRSRLPVKSTGRRSPKSATPPKPPRRLPRKRPMTPKRKRRPTSPAALRAASPPKRKPKPRAPSNLRIFQ